MGSKYKVEYRDIECVDVEWYECIFTLVYNYKHFKYKQPNFTRYDSDEKTIKGVIDLFIEEMSKRGLDHYCDALSMIGERAGEVGEDSEYAKGNHRIFLDGKRQAYDIAYDRMLYIEAYPVEEEEEDSDEFEQLSLFDDDNADYDI